MIIYRQTYVSSDNEVRCKYSDNNCTYKIIFYLDYIKENHPGFPDHLTNMARWRGKDEEFWENLYRLFWRIYGEE